ncbi:MAG: hypothetical protein SVU32_00815, partial [Candidatus Nanohaloarchaea archaeon]|nr:hypothetical protein [Candidatus Nanohaloarchaea archaeon]
MPSNNLDASRSPDQLLFRGRMQPWANHYAEVIDSAAQRYGIDEVVIAVPEIQDRHRCAKNPFTGEERVEMIEE